MTTTAQNLQPVLRRSSAGDSPAPVGDPPTATATCSVAFRPPRGLGACSRAVGRVAGRHRRVGCATATNPGLELQAAPAVACTFANNHGATGPRAHAGIGTYH